MTIKTKRFMSIIICGILLLSMVTGCDKGDESGQPVTEGENKVEDVTTDVVVVGGGGSGLTAAINVKYGNKDVILVEKMPMLGGNTIFGSTSLTANNSKIMQEQGTAVSDEEFFDWYMKKDPTCDPDAAKVIVEKSGEAIDWLAGLGMDLTRVINTYGHSPADGSAPGPHIIKALKDEAEKQGVDYRLNTRATEIIMDGDKVAGVKVTGPDGEYNIYAKAVILCAGGFAANPDMIAQYDSRWEGIGCSSSIGQTGDGILMAQAVGADVAYMENIRVNPSVYYEGDLRISMSPLRHNGAIMVNAEGKRFANEQGDYTETSAAIMEQTGKKAYMIFDKTLLYVGLINQYNEKGYFKSAPTLEGLAEEMGIDKAGLLETVEIYKGYVAANEDKDFGRTNLSIDFENPDYYGLEISPAAQGTFGGLKVDTNAQVINTEGKVIPGLYAAGENAGEGTQGASPLTENLVFGKVAALSAVEYIK
jgi:fumarate reductase flavoprotein subunit